MNRVFLIVFFVIFSLPAFPADGKRLVILHTNDLHSRLSGFSPESEYTPLQTGDDNTTGGFSRIAAIIREEKERSPLSVLTIDAGDFLMGTLFHSLETKTGFQLRLMKTMGYDAVCTGNHEFDFGPASLAGIIGAAAGNGPIPPVLMSNVIFSAEEADNELENLMLKGVVTRKLVIEKNGIKIGIFSLLGKDAVEVAPKAAPLKFMKNRSCARKMVRELKKDGCELIICLSHSGVSKTPKGTWKGEDVKLARSVKGIDIIISGHTHTRLEKPLMVRGTSIVQTGEYGQHVGRMEITLSDGRVNVENYTLVPVNDNIAGDPVIQEMIDSQKKLIEEYVLEPLSIRYSDPVAETDFLLECDEQGDYKNSNLGPLIADAIYHYVNRHVVHGCDVSMVATGVIRDRIVPGVLTAPDVFRVMSLGAGSDEIPGYPLSRLYVTGRELKNVLEILLVAYKSSPSYYCFFSGFEADYDPGKGLLRKINRIQIITPGGNRREVDFSKSNQTLYSITANSYMLEFIGIIKKMSFGLINVVPKDEHGNKIEDMQTTVLDFDNEIPGIQEGKEWLALLELLKSMPDSDGNGIPEIDKKYAVPVRVFIDGNK